MTMTVSTVKNEEYYEKEEVKQSNSKKGRKDKENYYSEANRVIGKFSGAGCDRLNISGDIKQGEFLNLIKGINPKNKKQLWKDKPYIPKKDKDGKLNKPPYKATDGTLSCTKDMSILWALASEEEKKKIEEVFNKGCDRAIKSLSEKAYRRLNSKNEQSKDVELMIAEFTHTTARPVGGNRPDMQLHKHVIYIRKCFNKEGQIKTIDNFFLFNNQKLGGALARAQWANGLRELGFGIIPTTEDITDENGKQKISSFKVVGISEEMVKHFSSRSNQILEIAELTGKTSTFDKMNIAQNIKRNKVHYEESDLHDIWKKEAKELFNFDSQSIENIKCDTDKYLLTGAKLESTIIKSAMTQGGKLFESKLRLRLAEYEQYTGIDCDKYFNHLVTTKKIERVEGYLFKCNIKLDNVEKMQKEFNLKKKAISLNNWIISNNYQNLLVLA